LQITPSNISLKFGLHPAMSPEVATPTTNGNPTAPGVLDLWNQQKLAVLCNVGPLVQPLTPAQYKQGTASAKPDSLFSHADQQAQWQSSVSKDNGVQEPTGWGGRTADSTEGLNGTATFPSIISTAGITLFSTGVRARPLVPGSGLSGFNTSAAATARYNALRQLLTSDMEITLVRSASDITRNAIDNTALLNQSLANTAALVTKFPNTSLGNQLLQIARIIATRNTLGLHRQIFFCSLGGFDTHNNQLATQASLLPQVSQAMRAFYDATVELGIASSVTTFTLSDFGRTFKPAAGGGTDHGWGNHHFIMGGAVQGGRFYGTFPTLAIDGPDDTGGEGRWIPTTSVDQYAATLATWYGLSPTDLPTVFPNLGRFATNNLGFLS
jgi:uncharacterized protein (DUF1501 family)